MVKEVGYHLNKTCKASVSSQEKLLYLTIGHYDYCNSSHFLLDSKVKTGFVANLRLLREHFHLCFQMLTSSLAHLSFFLQSSFHTTQFRPLFLVIFLYFTNYYEQPKIHF